MIVSFDSFINEKLKKNKWEDINPLEYSDEIISLVQNAYKKTDLGSFVNTKRDLIKSNWKVIDIDEYPDIEATIFYRKSKSNETFSNYKIQGIGHDGESNSIKVILDKLKILLSSKDYWIESSGAFEQVLYKMNVPYIKDESKLNKLFPDTNLKMIGDRGKYNRTINNKIITETVFGNIEFKNNINENITSEGRWGNIGAGILPYCKKTNKFLVALRSPYVLEPNTWGVWGGKLDDVDKSNIKNAAIREFIEETEFYGDIELIPSYIFRSKNFIYHNFIGIIDDEFTPELDWETGNYKWVTMEELLKIEPKHFGLEELLKNNMGQIINLNIHIL